MGTEEKLQEPRFERRPDTDYLCFTDRNDVTSRRWKIVRIPQRIQGDPSRSSRFVKILGTDDLARYDQWLWVDNRIQLVSDPNPLFESMPGSSDLALLSHDHRGTVGEEFEAVIRNALDGPYRVRELQQLIKNTAPEVLGQAPWAGSMILRRNRRGVDRAMRLWMDLVLRFSRRDQLSLNFCLNQVGLVVSRLPISLGASDYHQWLSPSAVGRSRVQASPGLNPARFRLFLDGLWQLKVLQRVRNTFGQAKSMGIKN